MKPVKIEYLFQAAKTAPTPVAEPMPQFLESRILAHWGETDAAMLSAMDLFPSLRIIFRWGLGLAVAVMLSCLAWSYNELTYEPATYLDVATIDTHMEVDMEL
jgi:hypothetical protein